MKIDKDNRILVFHFSEVNSTEPRMGCTELYNFKIPQRTIIRSNAIVVHSDTEVKILKWTLPNIEDCECIFSLTDLNKIQIYLTSINEMIKENLDFHTQIQDFDFKGIFESRKGEDLK
jgi:hypothetical protein